MLCNARHRIAQRIARWLLLAADRSETDKITVTHECISRALGVRRSGVTNALSDLEAAGAVARLRGALIVKRRDYLLRQACECYGIRERTLGRMFRLPEFPHYVSV